jgi:phosphonate transport system permease protein
MVETRINNPYESPWYKARAFVFTALFLLLIVYLCRISGVLPSNIAKGLSPDNIGKAALINEILQPDLSSKTIVKLSAKMLTTIKIGFLGTVLAIIFSLPLGFIAAFNLMSGTIPQRVVFYSARGFFNIVRAFEAFILLLILASIFGFNELSGILAIGIHSIGMLGKLYAEAIESVDKKPIEAIQAVGGNKLQVIFYGILPQTYPLFIGYSLYRFDINVRMAFILGYIGVGGIGTLIFEYIQGFNYHKLSTAFIITLVVISLIDFVSTSIRKHLDK